MADRLDSNSLVVREFDYGDGEPTWAVYTVRWEDEFYVEICVDRSGFVPDRVVAEFDTEAEAEAYVRNNQEKPND